MATSIATKVLLGVDFWRAVIVGFLLGRLAMTKCGFADGGCQLNRYYGAEFTEKAVRRWLSRMGVRTLYIAPGSPWENGYIERLNGTLRYELPDFELFTSLREAQILIERWRIEYNTLRPHSALGGRPPAPESWQPVPVEPPILHAALHG